jgi:hypothetical protein
MWINNSKEIDKMKNAKFILFLFAVLFLPSCAVNHLPSPPNAGNALDYAANDPDGDGDIKGYNYFPMYENTFGRMEFIFDPNYNAWALYDANGYRLNTGKASGGKLYCPDVQRGCKTIAGTFRIISKGDADCISSKYPIETNGGAPMPYCMYFSPKGYAIHGSDDVPDHNASHGCIRVTPIVAHWLNANYMTVGTKVVVLPYH